MCGESPQEVPLCGTGLHPIFFLRHQKENAPCTVEKKNVRDELAYKRPTHPKRGVRRHELPCSPGVLLSAALKVSK